MHDGVGVHRCPKFTKLIVIKLVRKNQHWQMGEKDDRMECRQLPQLGWGQFWQFSDLGSDVSARDWRQTMSTHAEPHAISVEGRLDCAANKAVPCNTESRKIPIAYEEVTLTDEAAGILEKERKAAGERPARKIRRVAAGPRR
jgi:hypothetical protein